MSNSTQAPGWWQATDGNWYPPESHPDAAPRLAPTPHPRPHRLSHVGAAWQLSISKQNAAQPDKAAV